MKWQVQASRYIVVGLASNLAGYLAYLALTALGMNEKLAMTLVYLVGVLQTFVFNKRWSFRFAGPVRSAFVRYAVLYAVGYAINLGTMHLLVDRIGWPHQGVMAGLVCFMAVFFFVGQRFWVFRPATAGAAA
jgi:putative flippase GtrA